MKYIDTMLLVWIWAILLPTCFIEPVHIEEPDAGTPSRTVILPPFAITWGEPDANDIDLVQDSGTVDSGYDGGLDLDAGSDSDSGPVLGDSGVLEDSGCDSDDDSDSDSDNHHGHHH